LRAEGRYAAAGTERTPRKKQGAQEVETRASNIIGDLAVTVSTDSGKARVLATNMTQRTATTIARRGTESLSNTEKAPARGRKMDQGTSMLTGGEIETAMGVEMATDMEIESDSQIEIQLAMG
jgi:hypothetical protein